MTPDQLAEWLIDNAIHPVSGKGAVNIDTELIKLKMHEYANEVRKEDIVRKVRAVEKYERQQSKRELTRNG